MYLKRIVRGIGFSFFFILLGSLFAYLFRRILAVQLSVADYGLFFSMIAFFSFFMLFIDFGLEQAATKYIVEFRLKNQLGRIQTLAFSVLFFQLFCSFFLFIIIFFFADALATSYFHTASAALFLQLLALWFLTTPFITFIAYLLLGFQRTTWYTALDFFRMSFLLLFVLIFFSYKIDLFGPILGYALLNLVLFCFYLPYVFSFFPELFRFHQVPFLSFFSFFEWKLFKDVFFYGLIVAFTNFGWILITQTDILSLTYLMTPYDVGLYTVALPLSLLILFFMRPVTIVFSPLVTELATEKKLHKLSEAVTLAYQYLFVFLLPFALSLMVFPEYIIPLLFDAKYLSAAPALMLLAPGTLFYAFSLFNNVVFTGLGKAKIMAYAVAAIALLNLLLNFLFIPFLGIQGAALSTFVSYVLLFGISTGYLFRNFHFSFPFSSWVRSLLCSLLSVLLIFFLKKLLPWNNLLEAVVCGVVLFVVYILLIFSFRIIKYSSFIALLRHTFSENKLLKPL